MSKIIFEPQFRGYQLYAGAKSSKGFYYDLLDKIVNIFAYSLHAMNRPHAAHFIIGEPINTSLLQKDLPRWLKQRRKINPKLGSLLYFATEEVRPRNKQRHLHFLLVVDGIETADLHNFRERLLKFSGRKNVKLQKRQYSALSLRIHRESGELSLTHTGADFHRIGSINYHSIRHEFADAIQRYSYMAKVDTKPKPNFIASRLPSGITRRLS